MSLAIVAPALPLHAKVEFTLTPNGVYIHAPAQQVQAREFQPIAEWPHLPEFRVFWAWPVLRLLFEAEDRAARAERRRLAARRRGIVVTVDGAELAEPITPRWPSFAEPAMIAWLGRIRERALADEPVRVEYGLDAATGTYYRTRLRGAWTHLCRKDLGLRADAGTVASLDEARARAESIQGRLRRSGRMPVLLEAEAV